jgi:formate dehydrogenase major subunit
MATIEVDGVPVDALPGDTVLTAILRGGGELPHVCFHPRLGPIQTCDTCLVDIDGRLVRACATEARDGLQVRADAERPRSARMERMLTLLRNHNLYCTICDKNNGDCELHATALRMGVGRHPFTRKPYAIDRTNPFFQYNPSQCILCGRCVQACQTVVVNEVLSIDWERSPPRVIFDRDSEINRSSCVSCGTCSSVCPVDALLETTMVGEASHFSRLPADTQQRLVDLSESTISPSGLWTISEIEAHARQGSLRRTKTVCTFCAVGCSFEIWTRERQILKVFPRPESPANGIATCIKGKFGWDFVNSPTRLTQPLIRRDGRFVEVGWDEAIEFVARRLLEIKQRNGPDAIGVIATCTGTNEEAYLAQKLARQVIGTHNVDNCARYCQAPATLGLMRTVGMGADSGNMDQIEAADLVMIFGSNTAEAHPVLAGKVKRAHKLAGQKLVVVDVRRHEMAERADLFVKPRPGSDLAVVNAVARYILDQGWEDRAFIEGRTDRFEEFRASLEPFTLEFASSVSGVPAETIIEVARMVHAARRVCILWAMGMTQHSAGGDGCTALCNLLLLTGNFGRPGTGGYPLRGHANVQGASDFGALPTFLPGYQPWDDPEAIRRVESEWNTPLPKQKGLTSTSMTDAMLDGRLRALYIIGEDKVLADADEERTARALSTVEFLVVQELFLTRTAQHADVILPGAASLEKEGTFVNTERRLQRLYRVMPPLGNSRTDFDITLAIANAMGAGWTYSGPREVLEEVARVAPIFAGASWERLEGYGSQLWPIRPDGTDSPFLYADRFAKPNGRAQFFPTRYTPPIEPSGEFDLMLDNGRMLEHFHWGNMTRLSPGIAAKVPEMFVEIPPDLARQRGIDTGDAVRVVNRSGEAVRAKALVTERVQGNTLFLGLHDPGALSANRLTSDRRDAPTGTPAYKEVPVRLERIEGPKGASPLPATNPRNGHRNPQPGVGVARKWQRIDYRPLEGPT